MPDPRSDKEIWKEIKANQEQALSELFFRYSDLLLSYGYSISKDRELIKDAIQELFLDIWKRRNQLAEVDKIKYYLFSALRRLILRRIKVDERILRAKPGIKERYSSSPEDQSIQEESEQLQKNYLADKINSLPDRQREIIFLRYYQGLSHEEIGEIMQIKKQATWNLLSRAVKKMRSLLGNTYPNLIFLSVSLPLI